MANLKSIAATLAILGSASFMASGCKKDATETPPAGGDTAGEKSCGGEKSCSGEKAEGEGEAGEKSCSGEKAEGEGEAAEADAE